MKEKTKDWTLFIFLMGMAFVLGWLANGVIS